MIHGRTACYFTSGFVGLNTPVGLSFQIQACSIQLVSAIKSRLHRARLALQARPLDLSCQPNR